MATGDQRGTACALLRSNGSGEKVVCLKAGGFSICEPKGGDKLRQDIELLDQFLIELPPALIGGKHFVTLCWRV